MHRANRGEWSELYAVARILADGKVTFGEGAQAENHEVLSLRVGDSAFRVDGLQVELTTVSGEVRRVSREELHRMAVLLLGAIVGAGDGTGAFPLEVGERVVELLGLQSVSASSDSIFDLEIEFAYQAGYFGYSLKSKIGSPATFFNASDLTNFVYGLSNERKELYPPQLSLDVGSVRENVHDLVGLGWTFHFVGLAHKGSPVFQTSLDSIHHGLAKDLSHLVFSYYSSRHNKLAKVIEHAMATTPDPVLFKNNIYRFITHKSLGLVPSKPWEPPTIPFGGFVFIHRTGEIVGSGLGDPVAASATIIEELRFDRPSTTRWHYGKIYKHGRHHAMNLNLQLRW